MDKINKNIFFTSTGVVFDPFNLSLEVTPKATRDSLKNEEFSSALIMALKLNEANLVQEVIEKIPYKDGEQPLFLFYSKFYQFPETESKIPFIVSSDTRKKRVKFL